jgi:hypothetical protein
MTAAISTATIFGKTGATRSANSLRTVWTPYLKVRRPSSTNPARWTMNNPVKVKTIRILKELGKYRWCGHSALMGKTEAG